MARDPVEVFSWIHLSDIHFSDVRRGERKWDRKLVLEELCKDVAKQVEGHLVPRPHAILVTGDIVASGAEEEYEGAREWLASVARVAGLGMDAIFLVPGNHDVQRAADSDPGIGALVSELRRGARDLDGVLEDASGAALLARRMKGFTDFARSGFAREECRPGGGLATFTWRCDRPPVERVRVRIVGLNTAILAADDEDLGKLRLGKAQLAHAFGDLEPGPYVVLLLSHHPLGGGWLADEANVLSCLRGDVHLSGHVHSASALGVATGGGASWIHVSAGACHGELGKGACGHGYNFASISRRSDGGLQLAIWPRLWSPANTDFRRRRGQHAPLRRQRGGTHRPRRQGPQLELFVSVPTVQLACVRLRRRSAEEAGTPPVLRSPAHHRR